MKMSNICCYTVFILLSGGFFNYSAEVNAADSRSRNGSNNFNGYEVVGGNEGIAEDAEAKGHVINPSTERTLSSRKISEAIRPGVIKEIEVNSVNFIKLVERVDEVFIPDPNVIDVQILSDNSLYLIGLAPGTTTLVINGKRGNILLDCKVRVTYPLQAIKAAIKEMYPDTDVEILSLDKSVILKGRVPSPQAASDIVEITSKFIDSENIVNKLSIETATQVLLKVKIAEVSRELTKSLGLQWRSISTPTNVSRLTTAFASGNVLSIATAALGGTAAAAATGSSGVDSANGSSDTSNGNSSTEGGDTAQTESGSASSSQSSAAAAPETATSIKAALSDKDSSPLSKSSGAHWMVYKGGNHGFAGLIDALASEQFASILAEPTLVAMSGCKAEFKSGGEYGYIISQPGEYSTNTTEYKNWGTSVEFTPVVISEDRINITVTPKVSALTETKENLPPSLETKEATTTVELGSGQSFAIAGLLQTETSSAAEETPFLSQIPLLGALFRNSAIKKKERELVIIVTPYIVKPSSKPLKAPTDMIPRLLSPLEAVFERKFHRNVKQHQKCCRSYSRSRGKRYTTGFSLK